MHPYRIITTCTLALALLAGCGSTPKPIYADPSPSVASSPNAGQSSTPPTADSQVETPQEFIKRWFQVGDLMQNTGATAAFDSLSATSCRSCHRLSKLVRSYYAHGGFVHVGGSVVNHIKAHGRNGAYRQFAVTETSTATTVQTRAGVSKSTRAGGTVHYLITVKHIRKAWFMVELATTA